MKIAILLLVAGLGLVGCGGSPTAATTTPPAHYDTLEVLPQDLVLDANVSQSFDATGGDGHYNWSLTSGFGALTPGDVPGRERYQSSVYTQYTITVTSGDGQSAMTSGVVLE